VHGICFLFKKNKHYIYTDVKILKLLELVYTWLVASLEMGNPLFVIIY